MNITDITVFNDKCTAIEKNGIKCDNPARCIQLCGKHYDRYLRTGTVDPVKKPKGCKYPDCIRKHLAKGWCKKHYFIMRKEGLL